MLALPWLESLTPRAMAQSSVQQKSMILFFKPNGCYPEDYFPHDLYDPSNRLPVSNLGGNPEFRSCALSSMNGNISNIFGDDFNQIRSSLNIYRGLSTRHQNHNAYIPFATSMAFPSIDQIVAKSPAFNKTGRPVTALRGTTIGYEHDAPSSFELVAGTPRPVNVIKDALVMFQKLFAQNTSSGPSMNTQQDSAMREAQFRKLVQERKVLDLVLEDYKRLRQSSRLSAADRQILEEYIVFIDQKQKELAAMASMGPGAVLNPSGPIPPMPSASVNNSPISMTDTMIDLMVAAIKTNSGNIFNFQLAQTVDETSFPLNVGSYNPGTFHSEISHNSSRRSDHLAVDRHLFSRFARTFKALQTPISSESDTTFADNSCLYISGDIGAGEDTSNHTSYNAIAASLSGKNIGITSGRALAYSSQPNGRGYPINQLLIGLMESVGVLDWRDILARNGKPDLVGFGEYGGTQREISDAEKRAALPFLKT
jgi:hypothetical protein